MPVVRTSQVVQHFSAKSAAHISGLTGDMVNYLCRHRIVPPSGTQKRGRGIARQYTYTDILLLRVISKLLANGVSVLRLRKSLTALQRRGSGSTDILSKRYVVTDGYNVFFQEDGSLELLESGQMAFAFVMELGGIRKDVSTRIERCVKAATR